MRKLEIIKAVQQNPILFLIVIFLFFVASTLMIFWGTQKEVKKIGEIAAIQPTVPSQNAFPSRQEETTPEAAQDLKGDVVRRTHVERGNDSIESIFYIGNQEVARQTISKDEKVTQNGRIPDGLVKFFDDFHNTYGEEHYRYNRKHGIVKTYYYDGRLKSEEKYSDGKLLLLKEYYNTGVLRLEVNYENASDAFDQTEVGVGKLYFPSGVLKYEWSFTKNNRTHFRKAYHQNGQVRAEAYYDQNGNAVNTPLKGR